jgi:phosphoglycerol transferase MdoB-like AlkP superfamily enzyme
MMILVVTGLRLGFALYYSDLKTLLASPIELRKALVLGLRFDLVPLAYINGLPFILINLAYLLPGKWPIRIVRPIIIGILTFGYLALGWIYLFDYSFYTYFQDHLNILFFGFFEDDTIALLTSIWKNYNLPVYLIVFAIVHYGVFKIVKFMFSPFDFDLKAKKFDWKMPAGFLVGLVLVAWFGRGSFNRLPLSYEDSYFSTNEFFNELSLNGVISLNRAIKIRKTFGKGSYDYAATYGYGKDWKRAFEDSFNKKPTQETISKSLLVTVPGSKKGQPHVVLIVMESFGSYWNDQNNKDFNLLGDLKEHFDEGLLFKNFLPAENGTIGSIVSVATSQVIRPGARFLSESEFMKVPLSTSGHLPFKKAGYDTHFVYGGKLGWRDLGKYLTVQGYDRLWGADEIKEAMPELNNISPNDLGNEWGVFDEYLFSFLAEQLRTASKPQFFLIMTTSNHPPFEYPSTYQPKEVILKKEITSKTSVPDDIAMKRFLGLQYANQKTAEFLSYIKNSPLKNKVITALTGDHSYWIAKGVGSELEFKRFAVPFFISLPESYRPEKVDLEKFGSHEDIFPSLYSLTLQGSHYTKLGESLFEESSHAMNSSGLVANEYGAYHHGSFWKWKDKKGQILEASSETPELSKLKHHQEGLISITDLFLKEEKTSKPLASESDRSK